MRYGLTARNGSAVLGAATAVFGLISLLAPGPFARFFGLSPDSDPLLDVTIRSVSIRDVAIGAGLFWRASRGGDYRPWLMARLASDAGDTAAVALSLRRQRPEPRFLVLGALAMSATLVGASLLARRAEAEAGTNRTSSPPISPFSG